MTTESPDDPPEERASRGLFNVFPLIAIAAAAGVFAYNQDLLPNFPTVDAYPADTLPRPQLIEFASPLNDAKYEIYVQLPHGYANSDKRYPVFYVLNGRPAVFFHDQLVLPLLREQKITEGITVGIDRPIAREFLSFTTRTLDHTFLEGHGGMEKSGGADDFLAFLCDNLIPFIDATYRTVPDDRALGGHSLEALLVLYTALTAPEMFNRYHASSPWFHWADFAILDVERKTAEGRDDLPISLYVSVGELERPGYLHGLDEFTRALDAHGYPSLRLKSEVHPMLDQAGVAIPAAHHGLEFIYGGA